MNNNGKAWELLPLSELRLWKDLPTDNVAIAHAVGYIMPSQKGIIFTCVNVIAIIPVGLKLPHFSSRINVKRSYVKSLNNANLL
jgi:hypothetical protein